MILVLIVLLLLLPVGVLLSYHQGGVSLMLKIGFFHFSLPELSGEKKAPAKGKKKKEKEKTAEKPEEQTQKGGSLPLLLSLLKPLMALLGNLIRKIRIDRLEADVTYAGADDPAGAAMLYGGTAAGAGLLEPLLQNTFAQIRNQEIRVQVDFFAQESVILLRLGFSLRIGQILWFCMKALKLLLPILLKKKSQPNTKEEHSDGQASHE